jgi:hypothetical protein
VLPDDLKIYPVKLSFKNFQISSWSIITKHSVIIKVSSLQKKTYLTWIGRKIVKRVGSPGCPPIVCGTGVNTKPWEMHRQISVDPICVYPICVDPIWRSLPGCVLVVKCHLASSLPSLAPPPCLTLYQQISNVFQRHLQIVCGKTNYILEGNVNPFSFYLSLYGGMGSRYAIIWQRQFS